MCSPVCLFDGSDGVTVLPETTTNPQMTSDSTTSTNLATTSSATVENSSTHSDSSTGISSGVKNNIPMQIFQNQVQAQKNWMLD